MNEILTRTRFKSPSTLMRLMIVFVLLLLVLGVLFWELFIQSQTASINQDEVIAAIEDQYGIHITMVAVTAGGGVVDFRFQVVDPEKANNYMHGEFNDLPVLFVENDGTRIEPREHTHHVNYEFGRTYYTIYRNPGGAVERGSRITAVLGDLQLKHIVVR